MNKLLRSKKRLIGGVCGGFANWFEVDPTIVRIIFAILVLCYGIGIGFYLLCWIITPLEK